jgi:hypothetical protein
MMMKKRKRRRSRRRSRRSTRTRTRTRRTRRKQEEQEHEQEQEQKEEEPERQALLKTRRTEKEEDEDCGIVPGHDIPDQHGLIERGSEKAVGVENVRAADLRDLPFVRREAHYYLPLFCISGLACTVFGCRLRGRKIGLV